MSVPSERRLAFVPETRVGFWFLGTHTWETHVVQVALNDLQRLIGEPKASYPVVLDAGCGQGKSFKFLHQRFSPERLIGVDMEEQCLQRARAEAAKQQVSVDVRRGNLAALDVADNSVDLLFCHQTFHHLVDQEQALREFFRVLRPGALLLFAESTRAYIDSWIIRLFFRHPMEVQRSAAEYMAMLRAHGFVFGPENVSFPYLWWSRWDLGAREWFGFPLPKERDETLVNVVARKP
jgi:ubiquinone/menaquinone biosynthesis C-methylase UbiE